MTMITADEIAKRETELLETYLLEYCEINGVDEKELTGTLFVKYSAEDNSLMVVNKDDERDVKIGVQCFFGDLFGIFGEFAEESEKYPKTSDYLEKSAWYGT